MSALGMEDPGWEKNYKNAIVKLSCGTKVAGKINIRDFPRLSDMLRNSTETYITVVDVKLDSDEPHTYIIHKKYIVWVKTKG